MSTHKTSVYSKFNMEVITAREVVCGKWWTAENISSPFTRVYMIMSGSGYLSYKDKSIKLTPGCIYIIPAGLQISYCSDPELRKIYFHISLPLPNGLDLMEGLDSCFYFSDEDVIEETEKRLHSDAVKDIIYIKTNLYSLICRCVEKNLEHTAVSYSDLTLKVIEYVETHLCSTLLTEQISKDLVLPVERLRKTFRAETGISIGKYIDNRLISKAELEVRRGKLSIKEISDMFGFCDQFYFSRVFTRKYGLSPSKYRKKVNEQQ